MAKNNLKYIAYYLPQFHIIPENEEAWGEGFTEWTNVKSAYPLYNGHHQPIIPHDDIGYYSLEDSEIMKWQAKTAKEYGLHGFCYYYYWFNGKTLLEKPLKNMLNDKEVDIPFCLCWANHNWTKNWDGGNKQIIIEQTYDEDTYTKFIDDLVPYFQDERYIKVDGKHMLIIYQPCFLPDAKKAASIWKNYAKQKYGIELYLLFFQHTDFTNPKEYRFDAALENTPNVRARWAVCNIDKKIDKAPNTCFIDYITNIFQYVFRPTPDYTLFRCVYPKWDNTARMKDRGAIIYLNSTLELFKKFLIELSNRAIKDNTPPFLFINAWNEWAEGAYLEPDKENGYQYLEVVKEIKNMSITELEQSGFDEKIKKQYKKKIEKYERNKVKFYLFGFIRIPFVSVKIYSHKVKLLLFGVIPLIKLSNIEIKD